MIAGWCRSLIRFTVLLETLLENIVRFGILRLLLLRPPTVAERAQWLHCSCLRVLTRLSFGSSSSGPLPARGLIVSNHLSHLDILLYGATLPCVFVAKKEVRRWPIFGLLAQLAGTVFIERGNALSTAATARQIEELLNQQVPVMLFPEGTSSDGTTVLRFHSALFESAIRAGAPITTAAIRYAAGPAVPESELCYFGEVRFAPHLLKTLGRPGVSGRIEFAREPVVYPDRRSAARETWRQVMKLRGNPTPGDPQPVGSSAIELEP